MAWGRKNSYERPARGNNNSGSPDGRIPNYRPDGSGRDTYVSHQNGGLCFQQPIASQQQNFENKLREYNTSTGYQPRVYNKLNHIKGIDF